MPRAHPRRLVLAATTIALLLLTGSSTALVAPGAAPAERPAGVAVPTGPPAQLPPGADAAQIVAGLSDPELVGQVLMPYVFGDRATEVPDAAAAANHAYAGVATPADLVSRYHVGGVILLPYAGPAETNISSPAQVRELTQGLQAAADVPLLIGIDQEYGVVARLTDGVTSLPSAMASGAAGDPELTEAAWRVAGAELAALGVNLDFAPVADVLADARGGVIGSRSYGSDPTEVSTQVSAAVRGLRAAGVASALKHFPGHGETAVDSHEDLPVVATSRPGLEHRDLPPFAAGIEAGASMVMAGHLDARVLDPGVPATFSRAVVTDLLRGRLGFEGVAVTDALNMAPARQWPPGEAAVRALLAGNDLLLMPPDLAGAYDGLLAALRDGSLPRERLVAAATRVVDLKLQLSDAGAADPAAVGGQAHHEAVAPLAAGAVTLLRGPCTGPLVDGPVSVSAAGGRELSRARLTEALTAAGVEVVDRGGTVIHLVGYGDKPSDLHKDAEVTVAMDTPYLLEKSDSPVLLATYSSSPLSLAALADVLAGHAPAPGRSPVPLRDLPTSACPADSR